MVNQCCQTIVTVGLTRMHKTGYSGDTRIVLHVPSLSRAGKRCQHHYRPQNGKDWRSTITDCSTYTSHLMLTTTNHAAQQMQVCFVCDMLTDRLTQSATNRRKRMCLHDPPHHRSAIKHSQSLRNSKIKRADGQLEHMHVLCVEARFT